jgi:hypothetical protein
MTLIVLMSGERIIIIAYMHKQLMVHEQIHSAVNTV